MASNSGTAALHLALLALHLRRGDAAVVPSMTFLATANVVRMTGADVIFADVDPRSCFYGKTFQAALGRAAGKNVKVAVPVHLNGATCALNEIGAIAAAKNIVLVEDACHALGVPMIGSNRHSAIACFAAQSGKSNHDRRRWRRSHKRCSSC